MSTAEGKGLVNGEEEDYTQDGTVDLKGRPVRRSKTGRWRASSSIVAYEILERIAYYGVASNLVLYLTRRLKEGTVKSANNVTDWAGIVWIVRIENQSRLDHYYALMAVLCFVNLVYYLLVARKYVYNVDATEYRKRLAMAAIGGTASRDGRG